MICRGLARLSVTPSSALMQAAAVKRLRMFGHLQGCAGFMTYISNEGCQNTRCRFLASPLEQVTITAVCIHS